MTTVAHLVRGQWGDDRPGLFFEDRVLTHHELAAGAAERAALWTGLHREGEPHIGLLLDNEPEYVLWMQAAALAGATVVGVNSTRRGADLARDIRHSECAVVITNRTHAGLLDGLLDDGSEPGDIPVLVVDTAEYAALLAGQRGAPLPPDDGSVTEDTRFMITFTSGSTGAPKAVPSTQGRIAASAAGMARQFALSPESVCYIPMPLFHGNAVIANWAPALHARAATALRRKFSASGFLADVRRYGATYFTYVGRAISYILATPPHPADAANPLTAGYGTEAGAVDRARFEARFGCPLREGYGSSEGGVSFQWTPGTPDRAIGPAVPGLVVLDPETELECARAQFDDTGRLLNGAEAIGELVSTTPSSNFRGYWRNPEATEARLRQGRFWTGDLFYRDADDYLYFAGRGNDWLRVDSENLAVHTIENILARHDAFSAVAVYATPDPVVGDLVMAAAVVAPGAGFDPDRFAEFLAAQADLGTKMPPRFVRILDAMPVTATSKTDKNGLRREGWRTNDPVWWQPERDAAYRVMTEDDRTLLAKAFAEHDRSHLLED